MSSGTSIEGTRPRIAVVGPGAVGTLWAALLSRAGHEVLLVGRPGTRRLPAGGRIVVEGTAAGTYPVRSRVGLGGGPAPDLVILAVKSYDVEEASRSIASAIAPGRPVLLPQNGLGIEESAARGAGPAGIDPRWFVRAVHTIPSTWLGPGRVRYAGTGTLRLPPATGQSPGDEAAAAFERLFRSAGIPVDRPADFASALWSKAVVNAVINPLTALTGCPNGAIAGEELRARAETLLREALAAAAAAGHPLDGGVARGALWATVESTRENLSSMLQDLRDGRPTEIDAISGALLDAGERHGLAMPETRRVVEEIRRRQGAGGRQRS
ncbi:MAG: 2-dehydropantoate 2-reductase [Thermoplasmata archaeon]